MMVPFWWADFATAVLAFLLTYAIHSTVLLAGVALLTRFIVAAEWRDVLWRAALLGGVVTSLLAAVSGVGPLAVRAAWPIAGYASIDAISAPRSDASPAAIVGGTGVSADAARRAEVRPPETDGSSRDAFTSAAATRAATPGTASTSRSMRSLVRGVGGESLVAAAVTVVALWLVVALALLARLRVRRRNLFALLADRLPVTDGPAAAEFATAVRAVGLRHAVRLTASPGCPLPMALTSDEVCVPDRFLTQLDAEQQRGALAHEVAHLARRDPPWVLAVAVLEAVFFFQPLNALGRRRAKEAAEYLCDDRAARAGAGLGLARCLETVAAWLQPGHARLLATTSAMAERRCTLVGRVERLLAAPPRRAPDARVAVAAALGLVLLVAGTAPAFTRPAVAATGAQALPGAADTAAPTGDADYEAPSASADAGGNASGGASVVAQETVIRAPDPQASLRERWSWALREAQSRRARPFWIAYAFDRPITPNQQYLSDSEGIDFSGIDWRGTPLRSVLGGDGAFGSGTIAILLRFGGTSESSINRVAHRSMTLAMDFDRQPVFWLGTADDAESVAWLETLLAQVPAEELQDELVDALALHATSSVVLPALARILAEHASERVRSEAAEGLEHHDVAASLTLAREAAAGDPSSLVRREAAEAIGGIRTPGATAVLVELALGSADAGVRAEAAEALEDQPEAEALPALERVVFEAADTRVQAEAVEALGGFGDAALPLLRRAIWEHPVEGTRTEAAETLGDIGSERVLPLLAEILERHPDERVQEEALDVLAELESPRARTILLDAVTRGAAPRARREAVELITGRARDGAPLTSAEVEEVADLLERVAFDDPDRDVRMQAVESMAELPRNVALPLLRRVIESHPDAAVRREAVDVLADLRAAR